MTPITGSTKLFFMIAHPIDHVRTPEVLNPLLRRAGIDAVMVPLHLHPDDLKTGWSAIRRMRNVGGLVVSVPLKEQAFTLADVHDAASREIGAANVVRREPDGRMVAGNLDGEGFLLGMLDGGRDAVGKRALLIGAGGAGRAIGFALARADVGALSIADTDAGRAKRLVSDIRKVYSGLNVRVAVDLRCECDILVNATPCGMRPDTDPLPVDTTALRRGMLVADIIMKPKDTPLLLAARQAGCRVRYGAGMLDRQLERMLAFFKLDRSA